MRHFANGLSVLRLYDTICSHLNELQSVFVHKGGKLTTEAFLGIIKSPIPDDEKKSQLVHRLHKGAGFTRFVKIGSDYYCFNSDNNFVDSGPGMVTLEDLLNFTTRLRDIPPLGFKEMLGL